MTALTVRLSIIDVDWLRAEAERSGLTVNAIIEALVTEAREQERRFQRQPRARGVR